MDIFKIVGTIAINNSAALKTINNTSNAAKSMAVSFNQSSASSRASLGSIAAKAGSVATQVQAHSASAAAGVQAQSASTAAKVTADSATTAAKVKADTNTTTAHAQTKWAKAATAIGTSMKAAATAGIAAMTALATAVAAISVVGLGVGSVLAGIGTKAYAETEQLVGGVETLYKESSAKLIEYADSAYQTAGLSANAYMEQATSFAASLLQGLGGNTEAAVEYTNMAITDMADNANKMGTSIENIQNAYQGFAKQNYTINLMSAA